MSQAIANHIVATIKQEEATFHNVILPLAHAENDQKLYANILRFYRYVSTRKGLRHASSEAENVLNDYSIEASSRQDIFKLVDAVYKRRDRLDPESQRLLEKKHHLYLRNGVNLSELINICITLFNNHLLRYDLVVEHDKQVSGKDCFLHDPKP